MLVVVGFTQGWFTANWMKVVAMMGVVLGIGGVLRTFIDRDARGEVVNLAAVALALIPLLFAPQGSEPTPPEPELPLAPADGLLPYRVTGTGELGLLVRSCPREDCGCTGRDCNLLGTAGEHSLVWVECLHDSGYTPAGESGSTWYKIRWSNSTGGTRQFFDSSPDSPHFGWIFSRYVTAAGPNENPSSCQQELPSSPEPTTEEPPQVPGIDVSNFQSSIDWDEVSSSGEKFAFVLASDGISFTSPTFSTQYSGAKDAGLFRGAYHFARPEESDPALQADRFLEIVDYTNDGRSLPPVVDMENNPDGAQCYGLSSAQMVSWIHGFLNVVEDRTGRAGMIYTSRSFWQTCTGDSVEFTAHPLWVAEYGVSQPELFGGWPRYSFWQYTNTGSVPGTNGNVDRDWWNGGIKDLRRLANGVN